ASRRETVALAGASIAAAIARAVPNRTRRARTQEWSRAARRPRFHKCGNSRCRRRHHHRWFAGCRSTSAAGGGRTRRRCGDNCANHIIVALADESRGSVLDVVVVGKHTEVDAQLRATTEEKVERIAKFANDVRRIDVDYGEASTKRAGDSH